MSFEVTFSLLPPKSSPKFSCFLQKRWESLQTVCLVICFDYCFLPKKLWEKKYIFPLQIYFLFHVLFRALSVTWFTLINRKEWNFWNRNANIPPKTLSHQKTPAIFLNSQRPWWVANSTLFSLLSMKVIVLVTVLRTNFTSVGPPIFSSWDFGFIW